MYEHELRHALELLHAAIDIADEPTVMPGRQARITVVGNIAWVISRLEADLEEVVINL